MNKIVREHYPVSQLPEDLRAQFPGVETVRLVIEEGAARQSENAPLGRGEGEDFWATLQQARASLKEPRSLRDAVADIRALRDEWDEE
ncbi:hypothetical protein [Rhizobium sp. FKL33]|uniref:hypothetical protein n=1 Tax=Rhizobium sp. FKL33 TaxID=2562307 RepID=UPI0010C0B817|nr:hypothetical protein [Rhizobium sp. FKL33]